MNGMMASIGGAVGAEIIRYYPKFPGLWEGKMLRLLPGLLLCAVSICGFAQSPRPGAAWYTAGNVQLAITEPAVGLSASWQFDQAENGDTRIVKNEDRMGTKVNGAVLSICDDRALLLHDIPQPKASATVELDGPIHMLQLALRLLDRGLPQGPQALTGAVAMDVSDASNPIKVKATNSGVDFLAPWRARGTVTRISEEQNAFDLTYSYTTTAAQGRRLEMNLVGVWNAGRRVAVFGNDTSIADWRVYRVSQAARQVSGTFLIEKQVMLQRVRFKTLGDLRAHIERGWQVRGRPLTNFKCAL
jgi:hypothetical protein